MPSKILIIDDAKAARTIVKRSFKAFNCEFLEAGNGTEGLKLAINEKPDLIVFDITVQEIDGVELLEKLKSEPALKNVPVIMLTALQNDHDMVNVIRGWVLAITSKRPLKAVK